MRTILDRIKNEPALLVAIVVAVANLIGVDPDSVEQLRTAVTETLVLIFGGFSIRQTVYGPKSVDRVMDAETVIRDAEQG